MDRKFDFNHWISLVDAIFSPSSVHMIPPHLCTINHFINLSFDHCFRWLVPFCSPLNVITNHFQSVRNKTKFTKWLMTHNQTIIIENERTANWVSDWNETKKIYIESNIHSNYKWSSEWKDGERERVRKKKREGKNHQLFDIVPLTLNY